MQLGGPSGSARLSGRAEKNQQCFVVRKVELQGGKSQLERVVETSRPIREVIGWLVVVANYI